MKMCLCFFFFTVGRFGETSDCVKPQTTGPSLSPAHRHVLFGLHKEIFEERVESFANIETSGDLHNNHHF